jgi:hypothetical protein
VNPLKRAPGAVYLIQVYDPRTGRRDTRGYVGKTRRGVRVRVAEHCERQPWGGAITGYQTLWRASRCLGATLWLAEVLSILGLRPLLNVQWNRLNRRRIPRYRQAAHFRCMPRASTRNGYRRAAGE